MQLEEKMYQLTCLSQYGMVYKSREENLGKICDNSFSFLFFFFLILYTAEGRVDMAMCTPLITLKYIKDK